MKTRSVHIVIHAVLAVAVITLLVQRLNNNRFEKDIARYALATTLSTMRFSMLNMNASYLNGRAKLSTYVAVHNDLVFGSGEYYAVTPILYQFHVPRADGISIVLNNIAAVLPSGGPGSHRPTPSEMRKIDQWFHYVIALMGKNKDSVTVLQQYGNQIYAKAPSQVK